MADEYVRFLVCKNEKCHLPIMLPDSSRLGKFPFLQPSGEDAGFEIYVCPVCAHVYDYTDKCVHDRPSLPQDQDHLKRLILELLNFDCAAENCGVRVTIQKPNKAGREATEVISESETWVLADVHCKKSHKITQIPDDCWAARWSADSEK